MSNENEKELDTWGFTKGLRTGLITFILGSMMCAIVYLFFQYSSSEKESKLMQKELYEKMLQRVDEKMEQPVKAINDVVSKVDTAAQKATAAAGKVDSLANTYDRTKKP